MKRSEHIARAMLLGMKYRQDIGVYFKGNRNNGTQLDAMTLEEMTFEECTGRFSHRGDRSDLVWYEEEPEDALD